MRSRIKTVLLVMLLCLVSGVVGWKIGDPNQYWNTWYFEGVDMSNDTITLLLYEEDIVSANHTGTRWEIEVKPSILYHVNKGSEQ